MICNYCWAMTNENGTIFLYVYSGHDPIYYNGTDGKGHKDIYLGGKLEVRLVSYDKKWTYMADALGSTRKVLWNGQATLSKINFTAVTYKPFGAAVGISGSDKFTYAGEMLDSPTGLVYLSARYYDPQLGRFYALDPELGRITNPETLNRYVYCGNNPVKYVDPTGKIWQLALPMVVCFAAGFAMGVFDAYTKNDMANWWKYGFAGGITWAEFPLILEYGGEFFSSNPGRTLGLLSGEYAFLKTYFITGDLGKSTEEGVKNGITGYLVGRFFGIVGFNPIVGDASGATMSNTVNGIIKGVTGNLIVREVQFKYDLIKTIDNKLGEWWDRNNPFPKWLPIGRNPSNPLNSCQPCNSGGIYSSMVASTRIGNFLSQIQRR
jgi:RHS repeat-associated protein